MIGNVGGSSTALTSILGDCNSPTSVVLAVPDKSIGIYTKDGGEAGANCLEITGGNNSIGINGGQFSVDDISNVYWGLWGGDGSHVAIAPNASANLIGGGETLLADFTYHWNLAMGAVLTAGAPTRIPSAISWRSGAFLAASGITEIDITSWLSLIHI